MPRFALAIPAWAWLAIFFRPAVMVWKISPSLRDRLCLDRNDGGFGNFGTTGPSPAPDAPWQAWQNVS